MFLTWFKELKDVVLYSMSLLNIASQSTLYLNDWVSIIGPHAASVERLSLRFSHRINVKESQDSTAERAMLEPFLSLRYLGECFLHIEYLATGTPDV